MAYLLLIPIIICLFLQDFLKKQFHRAKESHNSLNSNLWFGFVSTAASFILLLIVWMTKGFENIVFSSTIIYTLGFSACFVGATIFTLLAISAGPLALTSLIISYSLLLPTVWGLIFNTGDGNAPSIFVIGGILIMCVSLFLVRDKSEKGSEKKITKLWLFYVLAAFFSNGGCTIIQTAYNAHNANAGIEIEPYIFMLWAMIFVLSAFAVLLIIFAIIDKKKKHEKMLPLPLIGLGGVNGLANTVVNLLVLVVNGVIIPAYVLFPLLSVGQLTLVFIVSLLFYKERYTKLQYVGYFLGMASVVLLNLG